MKQRAHIVRIALIAVALAALAGCSGGTTSSFTLPAGAKWTKESGKGAVVDTSDNVYTPQFVEVKKGTTVTITVSSGPAPTQPPTPTPTPTPSGEVTQEP